MGDMGGLQDIYRKDFTSDPTGVEILVDLYVTVIQLGYHSFLNHINLYVNLQIHDITW